MEIEGKLHYMEIDTGAGDNFLTEEIWEQLGHTTLETTDVMYESATRHSIDVLGTCKLNTKIPNTCQGRLIQFVITRVPHLNLLGRDGIRQLGISVDALMLPAEKRKEDLKTIKGDMPDRDLQVACQEVAAEFTELFKPELGCLKDFQLEVKFKTDAKPVFCKPRPVPYALQEDLSQAYTAGIARGIWESTQFNAYGTPVVPIQKA